MAYPHDTVWDYVAITNDGVIPGWTGNADASTDKDASSYTKDPNALAAATSHKIRILILRGKYAEAFQNCAEALSEYVGASKEILAELKMQKANILLVQGKPDEAIQTLKALQSENLSQRWNAVTQQNVGDYYMQVGKFDEAKAEYLKALTINSGAEPMLEIVTKFSLASCHERMGDYSSAKRLLEEIVERCPDSQWTAIASERLNTVASTESNAGQEGGD